MTTATTATTTTATAMSRRTARRRMAINSNRLGDGRPQRHAAQRNGRLERAPHEAQGNANRRTHRTLAASCARAVDQRQRRRRRRRQRRQQRQRRRRRCRRRVPLEKRQLQLLLASRIAARSFIRRERARARIHTKVETSRSTIARASDKAAARSPSRIGASHYRRLLIFALAFSKVCVHCRCDRGEHEVDSEKVLSVYERLGIKPGKYLINRS